MDEFVNLPARRERPQIDQLGFDHRLMLPERLLKLAGDMPLKFSEGGIPQTFLDCTECGKGVEQLTDGYGHEYQFTAGRLLSSVLRHRVMSHGLSLSGGSSE